MLTTLTGYLLEHGDAAIRLLAIMLGCSVVSLAAAFYVRLIDRREARLATFEGRGGAG